MDSRTLTWSLLTALALLAPLGAIETPSSLPDWASAAVHFILFFGMVWLLGRHLCGMRVSHPLFWAVLASFVYGALLETAQLWIPGRSFEVGDLLLNGAGCLAGAAVVARLTPPSGTR